jgi:hypothetical protein
MVVSDEADPFHLSAGSPSTGSNSVSGEGAIAPLAAVQQSAGYRDGATQTCRSVGWQTQGNSLLSHAATPSRNGD